VVQGRSKCGAVFHLALVTGPRAGVVKGEEPDTEIEAELVSRDEADEKIVAVPDENAEFDAGEDTFQIFASPP
jgi:hypothetical protein